MLEMIITTGSIQALTILVNIGKSKIVAVLLGQVVHLAIELHAT